MLKHNLLIIFRNFKRNKTTFLINLIGLSTGLACALLIYLWVSDELSMDKFHEKDARLYQVMQNFHQPDEIKTVSYTPLPLAGALAEEMPEVGYAASVNELYWLGGPEGVLSNGDQHIKAKGLLASNDFF